MLVGVKTMYRNKTPHSKFHLFLLLIVLLVLIWSLIKPKGYMDWLADGGPIVVGLIIVIATYSRFRFTTLSYVIMAILSILEFIGAHYTFSEVPLFNWIKDEFGLKRNDYDRLGHFMKGFFTIVIREILIRKAHIQIGAWLITFTFSILMTLAALYEIAEMLTSLITSGSQFAQGFLGVQNDPFDSEWDMTMALIGSIIALLLLSKWHNKLLKKQKM